MPVAATVAARCELAQARVLSAALKRHGITRHVVLVMDGEPAAGEPFEALGPGELGGLAALEREELREALKPRLLQRLLPEPVAAAGPRRRRPRAAGRPRLQRRRRARPARRRRARRLPLRHPRRGRRGRRALRRLVGRRPTRSTPRPPRTRSRSSATPRTASRRGTARSATASRRARSSCADFDPRRPFWLDGEAEGLEDYAQRLLDAGWEQRTTPSGATAACPTASSSTRRCGPCCATRPTRSATRSPARAPRSCWPGPPGRPTAARSGASTRYLAALWSQRPDLSRSFADLETADGERFARWAAENAQQEGLAERARAGAAGRAASGRSASTSPATCRARSAPPRPRACT